MKFIEQVKLHNGTGFDICDNTMDSIYVCLDCYTSESELNDDYDRFCYWLASNLEIERAVEQQYSTLMVCRVYELVDAHYDTFVEFCKEHNAERYLMNKADKNDNIEIAMRTLQNMIPGNYSESDYKDFMALIESEAA